MEFMQERRQIHSHEFCAHPNGAGHLRQPGKWIADENRGEQHRQVQPKQHSQYGAGHEMHGQGGGRNERDEQPEGKRARHAVAMERPTPAIKDDRLERSQTPELLQRIAVRCDAFQPAFHGLRLTPTQRHYAVFASQRQ